MLIILLNLTIILLKRMLYSIISLELKGKYDLSKFITQKKKKQIELFISGDVDGDFMFEVKYDGKVQPVNAYDWVYFAIYKMLKALKEHRYEIIQNGNWFIFRKGIRELRIYIDNNYRILKAEYYKREAIMGILEFNNVIIE